MAEAARERGFRVREEVIEREELPGGTIHRLTLDHGDRGTAFEDLYDLSQVEAHAAHPAVRVGAGKTLYVHIMGGTATSSSLLRVESRGFLGGGRPITRANRRRISAVC